VICLDTTFLVELWRQKEDPHAAPRVLLASHAGEDFAVPAHAAGEFLEGGASISSERLASSLQLLRMFYVGEVTLETALAYSRIVAELRSTARLEGRSKADVWIAAWAVQHGSALATRNVKDFEGITGLTLLPY
jgi:predicted nucleic acid-binding protein